jgi:lysyl-tRNA synthetase class 2
VTNAQNTSTTAQDKAAQDKATQDEAAEQKAAEQAELSDQMRFRLAKRARLLESGREAYPVGVERSHTLREVRETYGHLEPGEETGQFARVTGRVVFVRNTGKLCFATLQEGDGTRLQVMLSLAKVGEEALTEWKSLVDLGDFVAVHGEVIVSRRGELSIMADAWTMASKALRPLPTLHNELNEETRVRQRYLDLIVRPEARDVVVKRARIIQTVRNVLVDHGYVEIETPMLQLVHGGASARPFETHLNAFDQDMTLRIATELYLKRAVVGGIERVYEIGRIFRNEGIDSTHSAEFTMLEVYQAWGDQRSIAKLAQKIIVDVADLLGSRQLDTGVGTIDLDGEWPWLGVYPGLSAHLGEEITPETTAEQLRKIAERHGVAAERGWTAEKLILHLFRDLVEPTLISPTFVCDYPPLAQPLARPHRNDPNLIEAWDLIIGGLERGTGFSELIDPVIQRERLTAQSLDAAAGDEEAMQLDQDFLAALELGAPPMGGLGLGIDRLVMLFTNAGIRETILFPLLKPAR